MTDARVREIASYLRAFNFVNYATFVTMAVEKQDTAALDGNRLRLSGALDLYSL